MRYYHGWRVGAYSAVRMAGDVEEKKKKLQKNKRTGWIYMFVVIHPVFYAYLIICMAYLIR